MVIISCILEISLLYVPRFQLEKLEFWIRKCVKVSSIWPSPLPPRVNFLRPGWRCRVGPWVVVSEGSDSTTDINGEDSECHRFESSDAYDKLRGKRNALVLTYLFQRRLICFRSWGLTLKGWFMLRGKSNYVITQHVLNISCTLLN